MVLAHDGTTKHEDKLIAGAVHIDRTAGSTVKRESLALFARRMTDGTAASGTRALNDALTDINAIGAKVFSGRANVTGSQFSGTLTVGVLLESQIRELGQQRRRDARVTAICRDRSQSHSFSEYDGNRRRCRCCDGSNGCLPAARATDDSTIHGVEVY